MPLATVAELAADKARDLPGFSNLSLPGIRDQVAAMLRLIGREGIFSTYTRHDISHIDTMLQMLEWVVPQETQKAMTPVDWLLAVLSIYFHDLGMAVTSKEFEGREKNEQYTTWRKSLGTTTDGLEYLARTHRMTDDEKERFFYQEYVRKGHAQRIREWVTGRHSRTWGGEVSTIAAAIKDLLDSTPSRFREYLGVVCESHHRADLDRVDKYPVVARFGNHPAEVANVQYAAILLRTTDLLHVTQDRTPSREYEAIKFSDPKSIEEWDKQLGTFAVGPKSRRLALNKPETATITINADFTEERPLFALQEYIAYADSEIQLSRRWAEKTQTTDDGRDYHFPWRNVEGDVRLEGIEPHSLRFELDRGRLLDLLVGHTIYNDPTVAIRELLQNSIDAVRFQHFLDKREAHAHSQLDRPIGRVTVRWDPPTRNLSVQDDGTGMDRDTIEHHLMSVGSSYYNTPQFETENREFTPISRFGIGILTCFMVSDDIEIVTIKGQTGHRIRMTSVKSTYLLRQLEWGDALLDGLGQHGTRVNLRLRDTVDLSRRSVEDILRYWIILPECEVACEESGRERKLIGFTSVGQALLEGGSGSDGHSPKNTEIVVKSADHALNQHMQLAGQYELAFGVVSGFFPEREFCWASLPRARVCIEGIRVSDELPGFRGQDAPLALLSVRGARQFRTTVSRSGIEEDEGYFKVARLCTTLLFGHVADEVNRISNRPGKPLSQAASAQKFLFSQLLRASTGSPTGHEVLTELNDSQPSLILEEVDGKTTKRSLISPQQLRNRPEVWTLESRSVDSLGLISRDLGRELSLNEFLSALAPDLVQFKYSPLLPEAHEQEQVVRSSHAPVYVEFSRKNQQTAIRWKLSATDTNLSFTLWNFVDDQTYWMGLREWIQREARRDRFTWRFDVYSAPLQGDDESVVAVNSRIALILRPDSEVVRIWQAIRDCLKICAEERASFVKLGSAITLGTMLIGHLRSTNRDRSYYGRPGELPDARNWRDATEELMKSVCAKPASQIPVDFDSICKGIRVFDATKYWLDWGRKEDR